MSLDKRESKVATMDLNRGFMLGDWLVEPLSGCFKRGNNRVHVEPKVMDVLLCLVYAEGAVVTREQMLNEVWTGLVVSEEVLTRAISELRTLLDDTQRERTYIRTVPKRGYALIASARPLPLPENTDNAEPAMPVVYVDESTPDETMCGERIANPSVIPPETNESMFGHLVQGMFGLLNSIIQTSGRIMSLILLMVFAIVAYAILSDKEFGVSNSNETDALAAGEHLLRLTEQAGMDLAVGKANNGSTPAKQPALAVLPFVNFSVNTEQAYFSDGLSEDIRNALIRVPGIKVVARTSSQAFRNKALDVREIGQKLEVGSLVEGTVRVQDDRARITVQLTDTKSGFPVWSQSYDRTLDNIFTVQSEIAEDVVRQIAPHLNVPVSAQTIRNQKAHNYYLLGRHLWHQRTPETVTKAIESFEKAIAEDDQHAPAYSGLADAYVFSVLYAKAPKEQAFKKAQQNVDKALTLGPNLSEAHASQGLIYEARKQYELARASFEQAVAINPSNTMARMWHGNALLALDEVGLAYREYQQALDIDPLHPVIQQNYLEVLTVMGRYNDAINLAQEMYQVSKEERLLKSSLHALSNSGRYDELLQFAVRYNFSEQYEYHASLAVVEALIKLQRFAEAEALLAQLPPSVHKLEWEEYRFKAGLALGRRDSESIRAVVAIIGDNYQNEWMTTECMNARRAYWLGTADYMDGEMSGAVEHFRVARDLNFLSCDFDEDLRISLLIYLGDSLALTGQSQQSATVLDYAQARLDRAMRKGWGHTSLRGSEIALHLINDDMPALETLAKSLLAEGVQPWANLIIHPIFDRHLQRKEVADLMMPFKHHYEATRSTSTQVQLAKFGLSK